MQSRYDHDGADFPLHSIPVSFNYPSERPRFAFTGCRGLLSHSWSSLLWLPGVGGWVTVEGRERAIAQIRGNVCQQLARASRIPDYLGQGYRFLSNPLVLPVYYSRVTLSTLTSLQLATSVSRLCESLNPWVILYLLARNNWFCSLRFYKSEGNLSFIEYFNFLTIKFDSILSSFLFFYIYV